MALTHSVRNLVVGSALTAGALAFMQGLAGAEEEPARPTRATSPAANPSTPSTPSPAGAPRPASGPGSNTAPRSAANARAARPADEQAVGGPPTTTAEEVEQPPPPRRRPTSTPAPSSGTANAPVGVTVAITTPGPLTRVQTGPDLNCAVSHASDNSPAFFADTACGTFLAVDGTLFGPDRLRPETTAPKPRSTYTQVSQSAVSGSGSITDPFTQVTEVGLGATGLSITQTDSYVAGQESYRTDVTVFNDGPFARTAQLYRAGDCVLGDSDEGFGSFDAATGAVACVGGVDRGAGHVPTTRTQQWYPISPGSHYYEDVYARVWARIGAKLPFPDVCARCGAYEDNAGGLSWEITIPAGGSVTRSHLTTFSLLGVMPLSITATPEAPTAAPGSVVRYTIVVSNPNGTTVNLDSIVDTLPAGFGYVPGSTSGGATTLEPTISGQLLTWAGPMAVSPFGRLTLDFNVRAAALPGQYLNQPGADAGPFTVAVGDGSTGVAVVAGPDVVIVPVPTSVAGVALVRTTSRAATLGAKAPVPRVAGVVGTRSAAAVSAVESLPFTGSNPQDFVALATLLLAGGGALVTAGHRTRRA